MTIQELQKKLLELSSEIDKIIKETEYDLYDDLSTLEIDKTSAEDLLLYDQLQPTLSKLLDATDTIKYLKKPIKYTGTLRMNKSGRYEIIGYDHVYTSGCLIEYLCTDNWHTIYDSESDQDIRIPYWKLSHIESDNGYYIVGDKDMLLVDLMVRVR